MGKNKMQAEEEGVSLSQALAFPNYSFSGFTLSAIIDIRHHYISLETDAYEDCPAPKTNTRGLVPRVPQERWRHDKIQKHVLK